MHSAARLVATVRTSGASTVIVINQRDERAADDNSSQLHVHSEDAEPFVVAAHRFDKASHWLTLQQSFQHRSGLSPRMPSSEAFRPLLYGTGYVFFHRTLTAVRGVRSPQWQRWPTAAPLAPEGRKWSFAKHVTFTITPP